MSLCEAMLCGAQRHRATLKQVRSTKCPENLILKAMQSTLLHLAAGGLQESRAQSTACACARIAMQPGPPHPAPRLQPPEKSPWPIITSQQHKYPGSCKDMGRLLKLIAIENDSTPAHRGDNLSKQQFMSSTLCYVRYSYNNLKHWGGFKKLDQTRSEAKPLHAPPRMHDAQGRQTEARLKQSTPRQTLSGSPCRAATCWYSVPACTAAPAISALLRHATLCYSNVARITSLLGIAACQCNNLPVPCQIWCKNCQERQGNHPCWQRPCNQSYCACRKLLNTCH